MAKTRNLSVFPALKRKGPLQWRCLVCPWDQPGSAEALWEVEWKSCWACSSSSLCFSGSSRRALSTAQCRTSWSQACSLACLLILLHFLEISCDREVPLCDTSQAAYFGPLCWVLHSCSVVFVVWQLCLFLNNIIFSFITIGEEAKLGEAKGKKLLKCSQMHYCCKRQLFSCQSFFLLFLRTECLMFI